MIQTTGTSLSDDTKIRIRNTINIAINSGDINIFQIQQVFQSIVQNVIIANNTLGPNATINVNQTAIQNALQQATANVTEAPAPPPMSGANETQGMITGPSGGGTTGGGTGDNTTTAAPAARQQRQESGKRARTAEGDGGTGRRVIRRRIGNR